MSSKTRYKGWDTSHTGMKNNVAFMVWYNYLSNLILSRYEWENLPETMNERFLEKVLYYDGRACFVNDPDTSMLSLRYAAAKGWNIYEEPMGIRAYSIGYSKEFPLDEVALIYNNYSLTPDYPTVKNYAIRLSEISRTIDINVYVQKTPYVVTAKEDAKLSAEQLKLAVGGGDLDICRIKENVDDFGIEVLNLNAPYVAGNLKDLLNNILIEFYNIYGINNANTEKKERLIVDEVNVNNQLVKLSSDVGLICRQQACEKFNRLYGTNIQCKRRVELDEYIDDIPEEGGDDE